MLKALDRNAERWALLIFYLMLVATMTIEVIRREVFSYSSIWGEEIVRYSFIYLCWIGAAAAVRERAHIRIDVILNYLSNRGKAVVYVFGDIVTLALAVLALWLALEAVEVSWRFGSVSHGLRVSIIWFYMAVPIGFSLMIFRVLQSLVRDVRDMRAGRPVYEGERLFE
jgi:TRAP-type C4-dicarboxylate transport system permease small subunit